MLRNYPVFEMGMKELAEEITELFLIIKKKNYHENCQKAREK